MIAVEKYGGSSVATTEQIKKIAIRIKKKIVKGNQIVVVASAMGKSTNNLILLAREITQNPNNRELDSLMSTGELQTVALLSIALNSIGVKAISLSGRQAGIETSSEYGRAFINNIDKNKITKFLDEGYVVCVAGFQGVEKDGNITTLGRGGSDTTAVALADILDCPCEIFTDVDGVLTIDPRVYPKAKKIRKIGYEQMMELAVNGAKVLETRCIELAKKNKVKLYIGKALEEKKTGSYVMNNYFEKMKISGIAVRKEVGVLRLETKGDIDNIIEKLSHTIPTLEMFNQTEMNGKNIISFICENDKVEEIVKLKNVKKWAFFDNLSKITLVGIGITTHFDIPKKVYEILRKEEIKIHDCIQTETSISITIDRESYEKAIAKLVVEFEL